MKWFALLLFIPTSLLAQYARMEFQLQNAQGQAISGAAITVFNQSACGSPASSQATLYHNAQGTGSPVSQPLHTDGFGQAYAYAAPGCYTTIYVSPATGTITRPDQIIGGNGPPGAQGVPGPPGGVANITPSPQFTMMYQPLAGTQSAAQGDPGITSDGSGALQARIGFGSRIASQWQTPPLAGNNGIANAQLANAMLIADPSYSLTETPGYTSFSATPIHYQNLRGGWTDDFYRNPQYSNLDYFNGAAVGLGFLVHQAGHNTYCLYDKDPLSAVGNANIGCAQFGSYTNFPGWNRGTATGLTNPSPWSIQNQFTVSTTSRTKGITVGLDLFQTKPSIGDNAGIYSTVRGWGGWVDGSGEGTKALSGNTTEMSTNYSGVCSIGCTTGSESVKLSVADGDQGPGRYMINTAVAGKTFTGKVTAVGNSALGGIFAVTVDQTVPISNAWGTMTTTQNVVVNQNPPFTTSTTFNVTVNASTPAGISCDGAGTYGTCVGTVPLVCFQGSYHEQTRPTATSAPVAGVQSVTMPLRQPHVAATVIMQGGMCGNAIEFTGLTFNSMIYPWDVLGSTDASTLQVTSFQTGTNNTNLLSLLGSVTATTTLTTATVAYGPTVYATRSGGSLGANSNGLPFTFTGLSDAAMNAVCTGTAFTDATHFTCTIAGLVGTHTTATPGAATLGINGFNTYAMAEVLDVRNNSLNPPPADGTIALEPNGIVIANGDTLKELNHVAGRYQSLFTGLTVLNPYSLNHSLTLQYTGRGIAGGGSTTANNVMLMLSGNANSNYIGFGGIQVPPDLWTTLGAYDNGMLFQVAPSPGASLISVLQSTTQTNTPTYINSLWSWVTKPGTWTKNVNLFFGDVTESVPRINTIGGTVVSFATPTFAASTSVGPITFATMTTPVLTVTGSITGGTLAAGTYCYLIQARGGGGTYFSPRTASEVCGTVASGTTGSVAVSWTPVAGATTSYILFGRLSGLEGVLSDGTFNGISNTTYVDTGAATVGSTSANATPQPGIDNAGYLGALSSTTAFQAKIQAPAGVAGNYTVTLPETATTGSLVDKLAGATVVGHVASFTNVTGRIGDSGATLALTQPLYMPAEFDNGTCTTAKTIAAANGNKQKVLLTNAQTCALTFTQPASGTANIGIKITQSSAGSFNGGISGAKWPAGLVPTITQTSAAVDFISCYLDGTNTYCVASQDFR